jgi:hypothetical protein
MAAPAAQHNRAVVRAFARGAPTRVLSNQQLGGAPLTQVLQPAPATQVLPESAKVREGEAAYERLKEIEAEQQNKAQEEKPPVHAAKGGAAVVRLRRVRLGGIPDPGSIFMPLSIILLFLMFFKPVTVHVTQTNAPGTFTRAQVLWNVLTGPWHLPAYESQSEWPVQLPVNFGGNPYGGSGGSGSVKSQ